MSTSYMAHLHQSNYFTERAHYLGGRTDYDKLRIPGIRVHEEGTVFGVVSPNAIGEMVVCTENHPKDYRKRNEVIYLSTGTGTDSWIKIGERASTKPCLNARWNDVIKWSGGNRWMHYANDAPMEDTWGGDITWEDGDKWDHDF